MANQPHYRAAIIKALSCGESFRTSCFIAHLSTGSLEKLLAGHFPIYIQYNTSKHHNILDIYTRNLCNESTCDIA